MYFYGGGGPLSSHEKSLLGVSYIPKKNEIENWGMTFSLPPFFIPSALEACRGVSASVNICVIDIISGWLNNYANNNNIMQLTHLQYLIIIILACVYIFVLNNIEYGNN